MKLIDGRDIIEHAEVNGEDREFIRTLMDYIEEAPVAEPKQGEWERIPYSFVGGFRCSCCGTKTLEKYWNFCPNCGARMKGADDE